MDTSKVSTLHDNKCKAFYMPRCSTAELFNDMSSFDTTGVMEKKGWDEICNVGELSSASMYNVGRVELHIGVCNATSGYTAGRQQHARERRL